EESVKLNRYLYRSVLAPLFGSLSFPAAAQRRGWDSRDTPRCHGSPSLTFGSPGMDTLPVIPGRSEAEGKGIHAHAPSWRMDSFPVLSDRRDAPSPCEALARTKSGRAFHRRAGERLGSSPGHRLDHVVHHPVDEIAVVSLAHD